MASRRIRQSHENQNHHFEYTAVEEIQAAIRNDRGSHGYRPAATPALVRSPGDGSLAVRSGSVQAEPRLPGTFAHRSTTQVLRIRSRSGEGLFVSSVLPVSFIPLTPLDGVATAQSAVAYALA